MPELPEVEIVARSLDRLVAKRMIAVSELLRPRLAPDTTPKKFSKQLSGARINCVGRRGKFILFDLDNGKTLIAHLRMTGRFLLLADSKQNPKFTHAVFYFEDGSRLVFDDQRHFGLMKIVETRAIGDAREIKKLAPEPLSDDFSPSYLRAKLKGSRRSVKEFLIDQTKVCGVGNIYASEALFIARVNPIREANKISRTKIAPLCRSIKDILLEAIEFGETLDIDSENISGSIYGAGSETAWRVYDREGQPCPNCFSKIRRIKQAGRSTYFCAHCQR